MHQTEVYFEETERGCSCACTLSAEPVSPRVTPGAHARTSHGTCQSHWRFQMAQPFTEAWRGADLGHWCPVVAGTVWSIRRSSRVAPAEASLRCPASPSSRRARAGGRWHQVERPVHSRGGSGQCVVARARAHARTHELNAPRAARQQQQTPRESWRRPRAKSTRKRPDRPAAHVLVRAAGAGLQRLAD